MGGASLSRRPPPAGAAAPLPLNGNCSVLRWCQVPLWSPSLLGDAHQLAHPFQLPRRMQIPDMVVRAREYFAWAASDTSGKVVGINPWHWNTFPYTDGAYFELGVQSVPALRDVWSAIGAKIKANALAGTAASRR